MSAALEALVTRLEHAPQGANPCFIFAALASDAVLMTHAAAPRGPFGGSIRDPGESMD